MPIPIKIDLLELILKGIIIGIIASAPMGPVGILCIQRTLKKGRWYGFVTGIGAAFSDITNPTNKFWLQISGSVVLMLFGVYCWKSNPASHVHQSSQNKGSYSHNGFTAFLLTFSNPLILLLFMASFAQFNFVLPNHPLEMSIGYLGVFGGALMWWFGLTWLVDKIREKFDIDGISILNKIIGAVVVIFSLIVLVGTVFNLYSIHY